MKCILAIVLTNMLFQNSHPDEIYLLKIYARHDRQKSGDNIHLDQGFLRHTEDPHLSQHHQLDHKSRIDDKLPGVKLPEDMVFTTDLEQAVKGAEVLVLAVPSPYKHRQRNPPASCPYDTDISHFLLHSRIFDGHGVL